jgi:hypothetical protein
MFGEPSKDARHRARSHAYIGWCMIDGETRAKLNGAMRDALRKEKIPFVEVTTEALPGDVIVLTVVTAVESQDKADRLFGEVAKRFKGTTIRREFKTPEQLAKEKAATLRLILQALTGPEPFALASIAEAAREPSWVIETCLRALSAKGVVQTVGEYDDNPTWTIATKNATYEAAVAAAKDAGFDVG